MKAGITGKRKFFKVMSSILIVTIFWQSLLPLMVHATGQSIGISSDGQALTEVLESLSVSKTEQPNLEGMMNLERGKIASELKQVHTVVAVPEERNTNEIIIEFKPDVAEIEKQQVFDEIGGEVVSSKYGYSLIRFDNHERTTEALNQLKDHLLIKFAERNDVLMAQSIPDDPIFNDQWGLSQIEAVEAWDTVTQAVYDNGLIEPVVIAVIDTGVDVNHPDLAGKLLPGMNVMMDGGPGYDDDSGHGTRVAGIISAVTNNGLGVAGATGTLPTKILPIKALGADNTGDVFDIATAIHEAIDWRGDNTEDGSVQKVKIINLSFGERLDAVPEVLAYAIQRAMDVGILVVAAAGNDGLPIEDQQNQNAYYPAAFQGVISVGALGENLEPHPMSNGGATLMAPGENILSTIPGGGYGSYTGTSYATPFVSAAASLLWIVNPDMSATDIAGALTSNQGQAWSMYQAVLNVVNPTDPNAADQNPPVWSDGSQLTASDISYSSVTLSWPQATDESATVNYRILQNGTPLDGFKSSPFTVYGLQPGTEYTFKVEAGDYNDNWSVNGPSVIVVTKSLTPLEQISIGVDGLPTDGDSRFASISDDGRFIVFASLASNLVDNDFNSYSDVFLYDRDTNTTRIITIGTDSSQADGDSHAPVISRDGKHILFTSKAKNLVEPNDTDSVEDLFLYDVLTGTTEKIAYDVNIGTIYAENRTYDISADGRYVAFSSFHPNGQTTDTNQDWDVFLKDRETGELIRLTNHPYSSSPSTRPSRVSISADGQFVAFASPQTNLVDGDNNGRADVFVYDVQKQTFERISVSSEGTEANNDSSSPAISADGRFVAFESYAVNLDQVEADPYITQIYVRDRMTGTTERISVRNGIAADMDSSTPYISSNGRYIVFVSEYGFDPSESGYTRDVYIHDRTSQTTELLSISASGVNGNGDSLVPYISNNGKWVLFESDASTLVDSATDNSNRDIFLKELVSDTSSDIHAPIWPAGVTLESIQTGGTYFLLNWGEAEDDTSVTAYRVYQGTDLIATTKETSYLVTNLNPGTTYPFSVQAGDASYNWSESLSG